MSTKAGVWPNPANTKNSVQGVANSTLANPAQQQKQQPGDQPDKPKRSPAAREAPQPQQRTPDSKKDQPKQTSSSGSPSEGLKPDILQDNNMSMDRYRLDLERMAKLDKEAKQSPKPQDKSTAPGNQTANQSPSIASLLGQASKYLGKQHPQQQPQQPQQQPPQQQSPDGPFSGMFDPNNPPEGTGGIGDLF